MSHETDKKIVAAALNLAERKSWNEVSMPEIALEAKLSLAALAEACPSKYAILCKLSQLVTHSVLETLDPADDANETPRERLFEVIMSRFDAMRLYKPGLKAIAQSYDPASVMLLSLLIPHSMAWMLEASGLSLTGLSAPVKLVGLTALYARVLQIWFKDETEDSAKTMAELDRLLTRAESWIGYIGRGKLVISKG